MRLQIASSALLLAGYHVSRVQGLSDNLLPGKAAFVTTSTLRQGFLAQVQVQDQGVALAERAASITGPGFSDFRDPFLTSTFPLCYALASSTILAYILLLMLFVTPRTFLDGGVVNLGGSRRWGFSRSRGNVRIGGRPLLQKLAVLSAVVSLTIATTSTFEVARQQYSWGVQNSARMQTQVMGTTGLMVVRLLSDTIVSIAQTQTLLRLCPRQRDRIVIRCVAVVLITLDFISSSLNSFVFTQNGAVGNSRPGTFADPASTLSYLFHLAIGLLYAAGVLLYSVRKRRFAFYHSQMNNISLVAAIALLSVITPVAFFILNIAAPSMTAWSDYVQWISAAATSIVVWEWVERIEALEREDRRDCILGREIVDGNDGLEMGHSGLLWLRHKRPRRRIDGDGGVDSGDDRGDDGSLSDGTPHHAQGRPRGLALLGRGVAQALRRRTTTITTSRRRRRREAQLSSRSLPLQYQSQSSPRPPMLPLPTMIRGPDGRLATAPFAISTAPSSASFRTDSRSTTYTVRYNVTDSPSTSSRSINFNEPVGNEAAEREGYLDSDVGQPTDGMEFVNSRTTDARPGTNEAAIGRRGLFRQLPAGSRQRRRDEPPAVLAMATQSRRKAAANDSRQAARQDNWDRGLRSYIEEFIAVQTDQLREHLRPTPETDSLPVVVISAPLRPGEMLANVLREVQEQRQRERQHELQQQAERADGQPEREREREHDERHLQQQVQRQSLDEHEMLAPRENASISNVLAHPQPHPPLWPGILANGAVGDDEEANSRLNR